MTPAELPGVVSSAQLQTTVDRIAGEQQADGLIPWFAGHHGDPWDHVEAAMALTLGGRLDEARAAFAWSANHQRADGSWPMQTAGTDVREPAGDSNQSSYLAVGVWHHWLVTRDRRTVAALWPVVRDAVAFALALQRPDGSLAWARDADGEPAGEALLTGSGCAVLALRCAMALAELVGDPQPDWELAAARLAHAVAVHPDACADRRRYSMDWYYPVLGGAVRGVAAHELLARRFDQFVVPGLGVRCVDDHPWVTAAETCELVLTLDALGARDRAAGLLHDIQFLRADSGGYWTGYVYPDDAIWPREQTTWTGAAVVLAADALARHSPASGLFRGDGLAPLLTLPDCDHSCATAVPR